MEPIAPSDLSQIMEKNVASFFDVAIIGTGLGGLNTAIQIADNPVFRRTINCIKKRLGLFLASDSVHLGGMPLAMLSEKPESEHILSNP